METVSTEGLRRLLQEVRARPPAPEDPKIDGLSPAMVLEPGDAEACARSLALCHQEKLAVVPIGAGTRIELGNVPRRFDVYLSTEALRGISDYEPGDLTVAVGAGTSLGALQESLACERQFLPLDPPLARQATIGGVFAVGEPGFRRRPGARPRDLLLGFEAILADGTAVKAGGRVVKNVAGYELMKLFVGSAGTLAVMTKAFVRLRALPERRESLLISFSGAQEIWETVERLRALPMAPEVVSLVNPKASELLNAGAVPGWSLLCRYEGLTEEVESGIERTKEVLRPRTVDSLGDPVELWERLRDFPRSGASGKILLRAQSDAVGSVKLAQAWTEGGPIVAHPDGGLVYCLLNEPEVFSELKARAKPLGANVVVEAAPPAFKGVVDVFGGSPPGFDLMRGLKETLDPRGILSPGRFVGRL